MADPPAMPALALQPSGACAADADPPGAAGPGPQDFEVLSIIGKGAFGKVLLVRLRLDGQLYAMKVLDKEFLRRKKHVRGTQAEQQILTRVRHPFVVALKFSFQTETRLYLVMEYQSGGELFFHIREQGLFLEDVAVFYIAETVLALEHLHAQGIIHRDLKPENLLLARDGHLCVTDFGLAKPDMDGDDGRTSTICGTNEYMAPEMVRGHAYGKAVDWWALGALLYEMLAGKPPFRAKGVKALHRKILNERVSLPQWLTAPAHSLLRGLLERNVEKRLGAAKSTMFKTRGVAEVKAHPFFARIDWAKLEARELTPPFTPVLEGDGDTRNFDSEFTSMSVTPSWCAEPLRRQRSDTFGDFSYVAPEFLEEDGQLRFPSPAAGGVAGEASPAARSPMRSPMRGPSGGESLPPMAPLPSSVAADVEEAPPPRSLADMEREEDLAALEASEQKEEQQQQEEAEQEEEQDEPEEPEEKNRDEPRGRSLADLERQLSEPGNAGLNPQAKAWTPNPSAPAWTPGPRSWAAIARG